MPHGISYIQFVRPANADRGDDTNEGAQKPPPPPNIRITPPHSATVHPTFYTAPVYLLHPHHPPPRPATEPPMDTHRKEWKPIGCGVQASAGSHGQGIKSVHFVGSGGWVYAGSARGAPIPRVVNRLRRWFGREQGLNPSLANQTLLGVRPPAVGGPLSRYKKRTHGPS